MQIASAILFVSELDQSIAFYGNLLNLDVSVRSTSAALLTSPGKHQLYLRALGDRAPHPDGAVGFHSLIWSAEDLADVTRCEDILREQNPQITRQTVEDFTVLEGFGPDREPVMIWCPGPEALPPGQIIANIYRW